MTVRINRSVRRYRDLHGGETVAILCNGPSLDWHALSQIDIPTIGLNASWMVHDSTYHVATDEWQFENYRAHQGNTERDLYAKPFWRNLFTADVEYSAMTSQTCYRLKMLDHGGEARWSYDLEEGVYLCTTITWYALQLARYMGFTTVILLGFDLCGNNGLSKFRRHPKAGERFFEETVDTQNRLMSWARKELAGQMEILNGRPARLLKNHGLGPLKSRCTTLEEIWVGW